MICLTAVTKINCLTQAWIALPALGRTHSGRRALSFLVLFEPLSTGSAAFC